MNKQREDYLHVVDTRATDRVLFAPLADGLFAASVAGTPWVSDVTLADQVGAAQACGYVAGFVRGSAPDLWTNPALAVATERVAASDAERRFRQTIVTPLGDLQRELAERPGGGIMPVSEWVREPEDLDAADWLSEQVLAGERDAAIREEYGAFAAAVRPHGVTQVQLELPYFLYALPGFADGPLMLHLTEPERYGRSMALAEQALHHIAQLLIEVGIDFIWVGAPGTELLSPTIWREVIIPQAQRFVGHVHGLGGRVHFHCCGQSRLWIEQGFFNEIGMDLVETLSPPPAGTVEDLAAARRQIDRRIVTRGNIDLGLIRGGAPDACAEAARAVIAATVGYPHVVGAADALLYGTPIANVIAIREACEEADAARQVK